jgi:uncharacterized protein (DUF2384 family)
MSRHEYSSAKPKQPRRLPAQEAVSTYQIDAPSFDSPHRSSLLAPLDRLLRDITTAHPLQQVHFQRSGVKGEIIQELSARLHLSIHKLMQMLAIPKATASRKLASNAVIDGQAGQNALGVIRLLGLARELVAQSTAEEANNFDTEAWLGQWLERPQAALNGLKPGELLDTPAGIDLVSRTLGSTLSGAYL